MRIHQLEFPASSVWFIIMNQVQVSQGSQITQAAACTVSKTHLLQHVSSVMEFFWFKLVSRGRHNSPHNHFIQKELS